VCGGFAIPGISMLSQQRYYERGCLPIWTLRNGARWREARS
jgi:hypothetical protein